MNSHFMFVALSLLVLGVSSQNIPVSVNGRTAFVEPEELMTAALYPALKSQGFLKVDVDQVYDHDNTAYEIEIYSTGEPDPNFKGTLEKVFKTDLGFSNVTVKTQNPLGAQFARLYGNKTRYYVFLNSNNVQDELKTLADKTRERNHVLDIYNENVNWEEWNREMYVACTDLEVFDSAPREKLWHTLVVPHYSVDPKLLMVIRCLYATSKSVV
ncbi:hypothetical protein Avbf_09316 [Armadillidium vulgare]|nr:hypothetical protein Avbf_09316 [Armadillidium vulgare]